MWSGVPDRDGIDVVGFLIEHHAEVFVPARLGKGLERPGRALVVDVAERDDVGTQSAHGRNVAAAHSAGANAREVRSARSARCIPRRPARGAAQS